MRFKYRCNLFLNERARALRCPRSQAAKCWESVIFGCEYIVFIHSLHSLPNTSSALHYILFAVDSKIFLSGADLEKLIELVTTELKIASDWFKANKLSLNLNKTNYIVFRSINKHISTSTQEVNIENVIIPRVEFTKFLCAHVAQHVKWNIKYTYRANLKENF